MLKNQSAWVQIPLHILLYSDLYNATSAGSSSLQPIAIMLPPEPGSSVNITYAPIYERLDSCFELIGREIGSSV